MAEDARKHLRYLIQCALEVKVNNHREAGTIHNLSLAGCGAASPYGFQAGEHLAILVHLPNGEPPMEIDLTSGPWPGRSP